jgi:large subunit ribosomal protein L9
MSKESAIIRREASERGDAEKLAQMLTGVAVSVSRKAGEGDHLFGSVTAIDVADALSAKGYQIDRRKIQIDEPIKTLGEFDIAIKLHKDVTAHVKVQVAKEE